MSLSRILSNLKRWAKPAKVYAIYEDDLEKVLQDLNLLQPILEGKYSCAVCGEKILLDNLTYILPQKGGFKLFCNKITCSLAATQERIS